MSVIAPSPLAGRRAAWGLTVGFLLAGPVMFAGAMGMASVALVAVLIAFPRPALWMRLSRPDPALVPALAFLVWATVSLLWSPEDAEQISIVWLEVVLGAGLLLAASHLPAARCIGPGQMLVVFTTATAFAMGIEGLTNGVATAAFRMLEPGDERVLSMLGRGTAALIIMAGPTAGVAIWMGGGWRWAVPLLMLGVACAAVGFGVWANMIAAVLALVAFLLAWRWPRTTLILMSIATALWLIGFPLFFSLTEPVALQLRDVMPFSWEWRIEAWGHARDLIAERRWFGWGVDSARNFGGDTVDMRGFELSRIPLHTHSGSMQIWLELGMVGAQLAAAAVIAGAVRIARAPRLSPVQAASTAATAAAIISVLAMSYGLWQEWLWGTAMLAASACLMIGAAPAKVR